MNNFDKMNTIEKNEKLMAEIGRIAEVAGYLWQRGWAEYNGGNISVNLTEYLTPQERNAPASTPGVPLLEAVPELSGEVFFVTGTGKRMRYVSQDPLHNGAVIRISPDGKNYEFLSAYPVRPTSELPSHLMMHAFMKRTGRGGKVVLHTHPTELVALTHSKRFLDSAEISRTLWAMIPECRIIVPLGLGIVPYEIPGTLDLARATIKRLEKHDVVFWEKHGILATGADVVDCFDVIDTLNKSAQIYLCAHGAGFEPEGMTKQQLDGLVPVFKIPKGELDI